MNVISKKRSHCLTQANANVNSLDRRHIVCPGAKIKNRSAQGYLRFVFLLFNKVKWIKKKQADAMQEAPYFPLLQDYPQTGRQHE